MKDTFMKYAKNSLLASLWFIFLTFPLMVIKVNTVTDTVIWRWYNLAIVAVGGFFLSMLWQYLMERREVQLASKASESGDTNFTRFMANEKVKKFGPFVLLAAAVIYPFVTGMYQTNIMITALMYIILGLGLNIVVGLGGLLHLGYAAFYAVGAYTYALLNVHFGISFWLALPLGGIFAALFGILLGLPVLRLKGDYLAIVTLGFGEIVRLVLENWSDFSYGPSGIAKIPRPGFFGMKLKLPMATDYMYFIILLMVIITIFIVKRLEYSRLGRSWEAMREDDIASEAMGIDIYKAKLSSFAIGAAWAGFAGVIFAAKTTFINPASFTLWESVNILCIVVLGGLGSIPGVILGALVLILLPEYFRVFSEYRMLIFGLALVIMMIFRPGGILQKVRKVYTIDVKDGEE